MTLLWATLPLVVALGALLVARWSAVRAGGLGCLLALLLAGWHPDFATPRERLILALLDGAVTTLAVVYVVFGGLVLFQVMQCGGAIGRIASSLVALRSAPTRLAIVLIFGWAPGIEAISGFGIGASVTAPLLLALGFKSEKAAVLALLGLCAVPWGALAIGTVLSAQLTGADLAALGSACALTSLPLLIFYALIAVSLAGGRSGLRHLPFALTLVGVLSLCLWGVSRWLSVELAGLIGGLATLTLGCGWLAVAGQVWRAAPSQSPTAWVGRPATARPGLAIALVPYALLVICLVATRLVPTLATTLAAQAIIQAPSGSARLPLLVNPGSWLLLVSLVGAILLRSSGSGLRGAVVAAARQWWRPTLATGAFVSIGQIMAASGMTDQVATALAWLGQFYLVVLVPLAGLAGFVTGSNAGANAMLASLTVETAHRLALPPILVLALLNTAAANATMASPLRVLLTLAVIDLAPAQRPAAEARVTRQMVAIAAGAAGILMAIAGGWLASR